MIKIVEWINKLEELKIDVFKLAFLLEKKVKFRENKI